MSNREAEMPAPENGPDKHTTASFRTVVLIVLLYAALVYLPFLGSGRTLTRHEVDIAQPAMRMIATGDYIVPYYEGKPWVHKPPLAVWMAIPSYVVAGGFNEYGTRLPSALCAIGLCVIMTVLARRFGDLTTALFTGLVQATCVYMFIQGRLGERDMPLAFCVTGANAVLAWHWGAGRLVLPLKSAALMHTLVGLGMLAKGPIAAIFVGLPVLAFSLVRRSFRPVRLVVLTPAILCSIVVGFWWSVAVSVRLGDAEWALGRWFYSYVERFAGGYHMESQPLAYYLWTIPWLVLPWSLVLLIRIPRLIDDALRPDAALDKFLWCWFFAGLVFLSIADFKHQHYCIPILPPLSIFAGRLLAEHAAKLGRRARSLYIPVFAAILVGMVIVGGAVMPWRDHRRPRVDFVNREVPQMPAGETLHVLGLEQAAVYPYLEVQRPCKYFGAWSEIAALIRNRPAAPLWVLTKRERLAPAATFGIRLQEVAGEPSRKKYPPDQTLVLLRAVVDEPR